jgi:hypothetical protein
LAIILFDRLCNIAPQSDITNKGMGKVDMASDANANIKDMMPQHFSVIQISSDKGCL